MNATSVEQYIGAAQPEQQSTLCELRNMIQAALPEAHEDIGSSGFPVYTDGNNAWLAGFASRAKGPMLYIMAGGVLDRYASRLGKLRSGKSCIEWRGSDDLPLEELRGLAQQILRDVRDR